MTKRGRSLSFERPRTLSSLEDELLQLKGVEAEGSDLTEHRHEAIVFKTLQSREFVSPWLNVDTVTRSLMEINRIKGLAARRQVLADTLRCCVVSDFVPEAGHDEELFEFTSDLDHRSICVISQRHCDSSQLTISSRKESVETPSAHDLDLTLQSYSDAYSTEDFFSQFVYAEDGSVDMRDVSVVTKTVPWFDDFSETVSVPDISKVQGVVGSRFARLKHAYEQLSLRATSVQSHKWTQTVHEKLGVLKRNFPRGIVGSRALAHPEDPRLIRQLIVKQTDKTAHHMMAHKVVEGDEKEELAKALEDLGPRESKYAPIPDMKRVWSGLPRVHWVDRNRLVANMAQAEHESTNEMAPWSLYEVRTFLERLAVHGKSFKRIATALPDKTEKDCVDFYYRFKIHLGMKQIVGAASQGRQSADKKLAPVNHKALIDQAVEELGEFIGSGHLCSLKQLERFSLLKLEAVSTASVKVYGRLADGDESPRRERRNAIIDVISTVIAKGHPVPPQLGLLIESAVSTPAPSPAPMYIVPAPPLRRLSLTVIKTDVTVVLPPPDRLLQQHNTI